MPLILNIDTSASTASICLSSANTILASAVNEKQTDHARWLHTAIRDLFAQSGKRLQDADAIAVNAGPGSYTGLRVGMATAKGLCYALGAPLITETSFRLLAMAAKDDNGAYTSPVWICPMIDARRMEVFTTAFSGDLIEKTEPHALILDENSYSEQLSDGVTVFCGSGAAKWRNICHHPNARFSTGESNISFLASAAAQKFRENKFADLAYEEPFYLKNVYTG